MVFPFIGNDSSGSIIYPGSFFRSCDSIRECILRTTVQVLLLLLSNERSMNLLKTDEKISHSFFDHAESLMGVVPSCHSRRKLPPTVSDQDDPGLRNRLPVPPGFSNFIRPSIHYLDQLQTLTSSSSSSTSGTNSSTGTINSASQDDDRTILRLGLLGMEDPSVEMVKNGNPAIPNRFERFPTVEERVKLYISNWYTPLCDDVADEKFQYPPNLN
eukprot:scaffold298203_cov75-Attheya_sp.AAC.1